MPSLSSLLDIQEIRARFSAEFQKPKIRIESPLLAAPQSRRYSTVGTALDYLIRFHLQRSTPHARSKPWVAEAGLRRLGVARMSISFTDLDTMETSFADDDGRSEIGRKTLAAAKEAHARFLADGIVQPALLEGAIHLARLDVMHRSGYPDPDLGLAAPEDVADLKRLVSIVPWESFGSESRCLLNPTFDVESEFGSFGADADLVLDDLLIDIKTVKDAVFSRDILNQLMGYYTLHQLFGFSSGGPHREINRLGVYFARHAHLVTFDAASVINPQTYPEFSRWFVERARLVKPGTSKPARRSTVKRKSKAKTRPAPKKRPKARARTKSKTKPKKKTKSKKSRKKR